MKINNQIKNAIEWIDNLPDYKQANKGNRGILGDAKDGYCCLGAGCAILNIKYNPTDNHSDELMDLVGLQEIEGNLYSKKGALKRFYGETCLAGINDMTSAGFKRIAGLMKKHPDWMFEPEVAKGIKEHYSV